LATALDINTAICNDKHTLYKTNVE